MTFIPAYIRVLFGFCLCLTGINKHANAQDIIANHRVLGIEDGLNFRKVNALHQDLDGLVWVGTDLGLQFYDGYNFLKYEYKGVGDRFKSVNDIERSVNGTMYISTASGVYQYDSDLAAFYAMEFAAEPKDPFIMKLVIAQDQSLYALARDRIYRYVDGHFEGMEAFPIRLVPEMANNYIHSELIGRDRMVFLCDQYDVIYNVQSGTIEDFRSHVYEPEEGLGRKINKRHRVTHDGREVIINAYGEEIDPATLEPNGRLYMEGSLRFQISVIISDYTLTKDGRSNTFRLYSSDGLELEFEIENTSGIKVYDYFEDLNGDYLLATNFGIVVLQVRKSTFHLLVRKENPLDFYNTSIRKIVEVSDHEIFFSQGSVLTKLDGDKVVFRKEMKRAFMDFERVGEDLFFGISPAGSNLIEHVDDRLEIREDYDIGGFVCYKLPRSLLVGGRGLIEYDADHKMVKRRIGSAADQVRSIHPGLGGHFYVGSQIGLTEYDADFNVIRQLANQSVAGFDQQNINDIHIDDKGMIWLATQGNGVLCLDAEFNIKKRISKLDGLPNDVVYSVNFDGVHYWFPTDYGLVKYEPVTGFIVNYFEEDGLSNNEFNRYANLVTESGDIYLGTLNGIVRFTKNQTEKKINDLKLFVSDVQLSDESHEEGALLRKIIINDNKISLPEDKGYVQISFGISDFMSPKDHKYAYRLSSDDKWISIGNKNSVELLNLAGGMYGLEILATSREGQEVSLARPIKIKSIPPVYKRWWFYVLVTSLAIGVLYMLYQWRMRQIRQLQMVKQNISKDLHDEVGSMLTEITILTDVARNIDQNSEREVFLEQISQKGRDAISAMSDVIWTIDSSSSTVEDLVTRMNQVMRNLLSPVDITFHIQKHNVDMAKVLPITSKKNLYLIFKEAIHNVVKHSSAQVVQVEIHQSVGQFQIIISNDNDPTVEKKARPLGNNLGLQSMKDRAAKLGGEITITDNPEVFIVHLVIPTI